MKVKYILMKGRGHFPLKIFAEKLSAGKINMGLFYSLTKVEKLNIMIQLHTVAKMLRPISTFV